MLLTRKQREYLRNVDAAGKGNAPAQVRHAIRKKTPGVIDDLIAIIEVNDRSRAPPAAMGQVQVGGRARSPIISDADIRRLAQALIAKYPLPMARAVVKSPASLKYLADPYFDEIRRAVPPEHASPDASDILRQNEVAV